MNDDSTSSSSCYFIDQHRRFCDDERDRCYYNNNLSIFSRHVSSSLLVDGGGGGGLSYCKYVGAVVKYLYEKIYFRLACYFLYFCNSNSSSGAVTYNNNEGCYCCSAVDVDEGRRKRQQSIMNNNSNEKITGQTSTTAAASKGGSATNSGLLNFQPHARSLGDENRFALQAQSSSTVQNNPVRPRPVVSRPPATSVASPKETVLPTAFVSPQTVQISVQPSPNSQHFNNSTANTHRQHPLQQPSPPSTPRRQGGPSLSALVAHYLSPPNSGCASGTGSVANQKIADAYCREESSLQQPPLRRMSMAAAAAAATADRRPWTSSRRSWVAGSKDRDVSSLVSFRTDYSPTEDLNPGNRSHRFSLDSASFGYQTCDDVDAAGRRFSIAAPSTHNNASSTSDERLNELERRLRLLESRLPLESHAANVDDFDYHPNVVPDHQGGYFSRSMRDLSSDAGRSASTKPSSYQLPMAGQSSSSYQNLSGSTTGDNNCDKVQCVSQKIRDLQKILEEDRSVDWRRARTTDECKQIYINSEAKSYLKASQSLDDLMRERKSLQDTVENLKEKLEKASTAASLAPDQYVTMQRYRLLKAKSKKLLQDKCEALRAAILEKESALVRMQLQNKELSELRRKVYEHECHCTKEQDESGSSGAKLDRLREELLQLCKSGAQTSSCLLGVCHDVSNKRCPDYDQILGLKTSDDENLQKSLKSLRGSTVSLNSCTASNLDPIVYTEQLIALHKCTLQNLSQMQKLMVDYYTNELVESVDCRIQ